MEKGTILIVNLQNPREKLIGSLIEVSPSGITLRGLDVHSFQDWMNQIAARVEESTICPTTVFFPMHRIVSCYADEDMADIPSFSSQFASRTGIEISEYLK